MHDHESFKENYCKSLFTWILKTEVKSQNYPQVIARRIYFSTPSKLSLGKGKLHMCSIKYCAIKKYGGGRRFSSTTSSLWRYIVVSGLFHNAAALHPE